MLRTHTCGELRPDNADQEVTLSGWVHRRRDHGGLIFIDLRDRYGFTQIVFDPDNKDAFPSAEKVRPEWVIKVTGNVRNRLEGAERKDNPTGGIEVLVNTIEILNESETPPFVIDQEEEVHEDLRLKYRYLDLRRERMRDNIILRSKIFQIIRKYFVEQDCIEIDTPCLIKGTPEGAREYVVPSRMYPGNFFVLPQSPQQLKQLCMVGGLDRYFQLARCFRDEDLRADRQPEFVQLDFEMSFCEQEDVMKIIQGSLEAILKECSTKPLKDGKVGRYTWQEVMDKYGSDKPDLRYDLPITDISHLAKECGFGVFEKALAGSGTVRALRIPGGASLTRSVIDKWTELAKEQKAKGLAYILFKEEGPQSPIIKFFADGFAFESAANFFRITSVSASLRIRSPSSSALCRRSSFFLLYSVCSCIVFMYSWCSLIFSSFSFAFSSQNSRSLSFFFFITSISSFRLSSRAFASFFAAISDSACASSFTACS